MQFVFRMSLNGYNLLPLECSWLSKVIYLTLPHSFCCPDSAPRGLSTYHVQLWEPNKLCNRRGKWNDPFLLTNAPLHHCNRLYTRILLLDSAECLRQKNNQTSPSTIHFSMDIASVTQNPTIQKWRPLCNSYVLISTQILLQKDYIVSILMKIIQCA